MYSEAAINKGDIKIDILIETNKDPNQFQGAVKHIWSDTLKRRVGMIYKVMVIGR